MDESVTQMTCYLLRQLFESSSLSEQVDLASLVSTPIHRYRSCTYKAVRDCSVVNYVARLLSAFQSFIRTS